MCNCMKSKLQIFIEGYSFFDTQTRKLGDTKNGGKA